MSESLPTASVFHRKRCSSSSEYDSKRVCSEQTEPLAHLSSQSALVVHSTYDINSTLWTTQLDDDSSGVNKQYGTGHLNINDLPTLILLKVFSFLTLFDRQCHAALVCRYWLQLSRDSKFWSCIVMKSEWKFTDTVLKTITRYCNYVTVLDISDCNRVTDEGVALSLQTCPRLIKLRLARCTQLTDEAFSTFGIHQTGECLKELDISSCWLITDYVLMKISSICHNLTCLIVAQCTKLTDTGVSDVVKSCGHLQQLSLNECSQLSDVCLYNITSSCHHLERFSCKCCKFSTEAMSHCSKLCCLLSLDVTGVTSVNDEVVCSFIENCKELNSLYLSLCTSVSDVSAMFIGKHGKHVTTLHLVSSNITNEGLRWLARGCQTLEVLDVGYCLHITDEVIVEVLASCSRLRYFGLMRCDNVSTAVVTSLVKKYPNVTFSTVYLEMKLLFDIAQEQGLIPADVAR